MKGPVLHPNEMQLRNLLLILSHSEISLEAIAQMINRADLDTTFVSLKSVYLFRAEKRSAQAFTHPLSQAQSGLFCVLTVFVCWSSE